MSGFDLVPVAGGAPVHLPPGETVLGRGPFLGVSDKRVSRHHGLLENLNGQLRLKPTHLNPCFIQSSPADENPRPLKRESWYPLHHGDFFSLLPGQLIYKVVAVGGDECTPRNRQILEVEEDEFPSSLEPDVELSHPIRPEPGQTPTHQEPTLAALSNEDDNCPSRSLNKEDAALPKEGEDDRCDVPPSGAKKRVLPAWMMAPAAPSSPKVQSTERRIEAPARASTSSKRATAAQATPTTSEEAGLSDEEEKRPRKRRRKIRDEVEDEEAQSKPDVPSEEPMLRTQDVEGEGGEASTAGRTATQTSGVSESEKDETKLREGRQWTGGVGLNGGAVSGSAPSKPRLRAPCPYGRGCYRKNPVHFQECSHPGDSDYEEEEEEEEEERPECPYGSDCYRKNPLHRKEFSHTKKPARAARAVHKSSPEDEEDEEDEDSFIDDDSEDVGDDSDYVPPDSDDSGKEDVKRLQKEAKAFLKRRR